MTDTRSILAGLGKSYNAVTEQGWRPRLGDSEPNQSDRLYMLNAIICKGKCRAWYCAFRFQVVREGQQVRDGAYTWSLNAKNQRQ